MFGLFRSRGENLVRKLEGQLLVQEAAYENGSWGIFIHVGRQISVTLSEIQYSNWNEEKINEFLVKRKLVKSLTVDGYRQKMMEAQERAGAFY